MFDKISALKKIALSPDYIPDRQSALDYRPNRQSALDYRPNRQSALDYRPNRQSALDYRPNRQSALEYRPNRQSALEYRPNRQSALDYKRYPTSSSLDTVYSRKNVWEDHSEFFEKIRRMNQMFENTVKANPGKSRKEVSIALKKYFRQQKQKGN